MEFTCFDLIFFPRKKLFSLLGGTSSDFGGHSLEMPARGIGPATFFLGHNPCLGGGTFLV